MPTSFCDRAIRAVSQTVGACRARPAGFSPERTNRHGIDGLLALMSGANPSVNLPARDDRGRVAASAAGCHTRCSRSHGASLPDPLRRGAPRERGTRSSFFLEESHLAKVADPAAGSGGIENLEPQACAAAYTFSGYRDGTWGVADALEQGLVQTRSARRRASARRTLPRRRDALTARRVSDITRAECRPDVAPLPFRADARSQMPAAAPHSSRRPFEAYSNCLRTSARAKTVARGHDSSFLAHLGKLAELHGRRTPVRRGFPSRPA